LTHTLNEIMKWSKEVTVHDMKVHGGVEL
jgi:hypothetical protein